jgi:hypothetical protein
MAMAKHVGVDSPLQLRLENARKSLPVGHGLCVASRDAAYTRARAGMIQELEPPHSQGELEHAGLIPPASQKRPSDKVLQCIRTAFAKVAFANSVNF